MAARALREDKCRHCDRMVDWRQPGGLTFGDKSCAHVECYERAEIRRIEEAAKRAADPRHLQDPAEVTLRGELSAMEDTKQPTPDEIRAIEACLPAVGSYVAKVGMEKPLAEYSRDEICGLVWKSVRAFQIEMATVLDSDIPF